MKTGNITLVVGLDSNGHFMAASLWDRKRAIELLQQIEDGDLLVNEFEDVEKELESTKKMENSQWIEWLNNLSCRGRLEVINLLVDVDD